MSKDITSPLIVGAGPVGLAAALFLLRKGIRVRLIDEKPQPSVNSRALAINPRTLEIFEKCGLIETILSAGKKITHAHMWRQDRLLAEIMLDIEHTYPFMIALSQAATERILAAALEKSGGIIERATQLKACGTIGNKIVAEIATGNAREKLTPSWLLAADGAHSTVRSELTIPFTGSSLKNEWYLADVPLMTDLPENSAHIFFLDGGRFLFLIRVIDDNPALASGAPLWRVIGNFDSILTSVPHVKTAGVPVWQSHFHISHKIASSFCRENIYLAGDAAHIHSPIGARGMNLGIEDAWVFANLVAMNKMDEYNERRRPVDRRVVSNVEKFTQIVVSDSELLQTVRTYLMPALIHIQPLREYFFKIVTGLDHPLEF